MTCKLYVSHQNKVTTTKWTSTYLCQKLIKANVPPQDFPQFYLSCSEMLESTF